MGKTLNKTTQYTIRNVPKTLDAALRKAAKASKKSLNQTAVEALAKGLDITDSPVLHHDLDFMAGTWVEDPAFDEAIRDQDRVFPEDWKY